MNKLKVSALPNPERIADGIEAGQVQRESYFYNNIFFGKRGKSGFNFVAQIFSVIRSAAKELLSSA